MIKRSVDQSSKVAQQFLTNFATKKLKNQGTQTDALDDIFEVHEAEISTLKANL